MKLTICLVVVCAMLSGCKSKKPPEGPAYQTVGRDPRRDTDTARAENTKALDLMNKGEWAAAETSLKNALAADVMFGPAHNNLGKIYFQQNKLYLAAWEFEYASKLMPHQAEPKNNMGLVFEAVGKFNEAIDNYNQAVGLEPENPELIGNNARARVRRGDTGPELREMLQKLVLMDTRPQWVSWAKRRLVLIPETPMNLAPTTQKS